MLRFRSCTTIAAVGLAAALATPSTTAQQINRVIPEAAGPGDLLILEGVNLGGAQDVEFFAIVGGFVGVRTLSVAAQSVSATRVTVQVPLVNSFVPPGAIPPSDPVGTVQLLPAPGFAGTGTEPFFYLEATFGDVTTVGNGTTQPGGIGRPAVGFTIAGGPPEAGNRGFTPTVGNAVPAAPAILAIGFPAMPPYSMQGDGTVVVDLNLPLATVILVTSATGDAQLNLPIPGMPLNTNFMLQWAMIDPATLAIYVSNGLQIAL